MPRKFEVGQTQQGQTRWTIMMTALNDTGVSGCTDCGKEELTKSQFITREGTYKLMTLSEYSRPSRVPLNPTQGNIVSRNTQVHVSFVSVPVSDSEVGSSSDRICFNVGRELFVYNYEGAADLTRPIDKRIYKGTYPTCHDFNQAEASLDYCPLLIGFSAGQVQLINPFKKENHLNKLFNEERVIERSRVTCLRWVPGSAHHFLAAYASGFMYLYNDEVMCSCYLPSYLLLKKSDGFAIHTCKTKSSRNPIYRWTIGEGAINEFAFSPDGKSLAVVSEDGYLRVFNYNAMELIGLMRSYFGGLLCLAWSPDMKYIVTGGEDDLISVFSIAEKRTVCRGEGHLSWVSRVAFDPYTSLISCNGSALRLDSEEDLGSVSQKEFSASTLNSSVLNGDQPLSRNQSQKQSVSSVNSLGRVSYRFGSVGHDTHLCLWDLTDDELKAPAARLRNSVLFSHSPVIPNNRGSNSASDGILTTQTKPADTNQHSATAKSKRILISFAGKNFDKCCAPVKGSGNAVNPVSVQESKTVLGTLICPYLQDVPMIQPLINKKISHERLSVLVFREDSIVTACQEGFICTWARPGRTGLSKKHSIGSPKTGSAPNLLPGGTIV
ncbi:unnamed protein product [Soboliphyme baturini]|uniref:WD_REPEATS_REGION domain-containing protein n=1 Tax=Soboliphyme baturini TaxID=241478 RepID=A0A183IL87_9BILA|nr:unnamed protein product [Soboliphyme baturini]